MEHTDIEIREHEIENILGRTPGVLLRVGITVVFIVFLVIIIGSSYFYYPDTITAKVVVVSQYAPLPLLSMNGGKIGSLPVVDKQKINSGTIVAVMENAADIEDMLILEDFLCGKYNNSVALLDRELQLGDVHNAFVAWKYAFIAFANFQKLQYHEKSIQALKEQMDLIQKYISYGEQQNIYLNEQLELEKKKFQSDQYLSKNNVISGAELDKSRMELLQKQSGAEANKAAMIDSKVRMVQLKQTIMDMRLDYDKQRNTLDDLVRHSLETLAAQVKQWEQMYLVKAPASGRLVYTRYWLPGEFVTSGETIFMLLLQDGDVFEGRIELPMIKSGKVREGQEVHIKLDNYPYMEYGVLQGTVKHISAVANKEIYRVDVTLPKGLISSYQQELPFLQGMSGIANIITNKQSIFQRLLFPLKSLTTSHKKE